MLGEDEKKSVENNKGDLREIENPGASGAFDCARETTSTDLSPTSGLKSGSNVPIAQFEFKPKGIKVADIRLSQDFDNNATVKKVPTYIRVDKPPKHVFFMVRKESFWSVDVWILEFKEDRETYLVHPNTLQSVGDLAVPTTLYTAITRNGDIFFLPVRISRSDSRSDSWNDSRRAAAELAKNKWLRMSANTNAGCYDIYEATGNIPDPEWPTDLTFEDLLNIAFKDRMIEGHDHPVLKKLRGEI